MVLAGQIITLLLFSFQNSGLSATGDEYAPREVQFQAIDLNLTLKWNPPAVSVLEGETILYTVIHRKRIKRGSEESSIPHCTNITETECYLLPMFSSIKDFAYKELFFVTCISTGSSNITGTSPLKDFTNRQVVASAPVIYNTSITTSNITVWIHGPETPFTKRGRNLFLVEEALGKGKFQLQNIYFNSSLRRRNAIDFEKTTSVKESIDGRAELVYSHLLPYTSYTLKVQSRLNGLFSANVTSYTFHTKQKAPEFGPVLSGIEVTRRYCDYRDISIHWEDSDRQRPNVALTQYVVDVTDSESNQTTNISVSSSVRSVILRKLNRWHKYQVMVTSYNSGGGKEGDMEAIEKDVHMLETYKPTIKSIKEASTTNWTMTWTTPRDHEQCIVGYIIEAISSDGFLQEKIFVDGFNTSTASLHIKKPGRHKIVLRPIVNNDSVDTKVEATTHIDVKDLNNRGTIIFVGLALLATIMLTGVVVMTKKVFCDTSDLPDIAKINPMNRSGDDQPVRTSLRKPPEKEIFHLPRILPSHHFKSYSPSNCQSDDDTFQPKSSSTCVLVHANQFIDKNISMTKEINDEFSPQPLLDDLNGNENQEIFSHENKISFDPPDDLPEANTRTEDEPSAGSLPDGYVAHSFSKKPPALQVFIPSVPYVCPQSLSSDSGFASSPNSQSDYVPPSPFTDSSYFVYPDNSPTSQSAEDPYVKDEVAGRHGRTQTSSISRDVTVDCPMYNRIDSRQSLADPYPKGYLTMNSILTSQK